MVFVNYLIDNIYPENVAFWSDSEEISHDLKENLKFSSENLQLHLLAGPKRCVE